MICAYIRELCYLLLSPAISAVLFSLFGCSLGSV